MSNPAPGWYPAPHANNEQRYWDGSQWIEPAPQAPTPAPKKSKRGWIIAGAVLAGLIVVGVVGGAISGALTSPSAEPRTTVTPWHPPATTAPPAEETTEGAEEPATPLVVRQDFTGSGDMVLDVNITQVAIITFACGDCSRNTVLKSNGAESLIVNEIGAYSGSHLVNINDGSMITQLVIEAQGNWSLTIDDVSTAPKVDKAATGTGSSVVIFTGAFDSAAITNDGASNFVVKAYGGDNWSPLIVNHIGAYSGTVEMSTPAVVQVESSGNWSITGQ